MQNKLIIFIALPTFLNALYNPFFTVDQAPKGQAIQKVIVKEVRPKTERQNIKISYFGYVESLKGKFALIKFNGKNIVVSQQSPLYIGKRIYKVKKITSNYIIIKDREGRLQSIYFSTMKENEGRN